MVLSSIFAQSLIVANLPCPASQRIKKKLAEKSYNNAILPDFDMISDDSCFDDAVSAYMNIITNLHRIVVKSSPVCLIRRPGFMDMIPWRRSESSIHTS